MNNKTKFTTMWVDVKELGSPFVVVQDEEGNWEVIDMEELYEE